MTVVDAPSGSSHRPPRAASRSLLVRRVLWVGFGATTAVACLIALLAWLALHIEWRVPDPAALSGPSRVLDRDGQVLARFASEVDRRVVGLDEVSEHAQAAVIASEDARFYSHEGVDPVALIRAIATNVRTGEISQGGSTLTQQYVKNAFVGNERTLLRKVREAVISIQLERDLPKAAILERYLNTVYFGEGAYGIEAAALTYFGVSADELTVAQSALLAQALPAPSVRNPRSDPAGARARAGVVIGQMQASASITPAEARTAMAADVEVQPRRRTTSSAPFFTAYVRAQLERAYGRQAVLSGALTVRTSLDLEAQQAVDEAVAARLEPDDAGEVQAGAVAIDPRTGQILAIHGGRDFRAHQFDLATQARRQNGSAFKPLVHVAALEEGIEPDERLPSPGRITIPASDCVDHDGGPISVRGGPGGSLTIREGLVRSVNTVYQQLGCRLGGPRVVETATRMGVRNRVTSEAAVALGGPRYGASVLDMASAFATLANDGLSCPAHAILEVHGPDGQPLPAPVETTIVPGMEDRPRRLTDAELAARPEGLAQLDPQPDPDRAPAHRCVAAVHPDVARTTTQALEAVVERGTGERADIGRPQAGKTGTTDDEKDAWFVGYTPDLSLAVWVGDPDFDGDGVRPMRDIGGFARVQGGTVPARIWADAAEMVLEGVPETDFLEPGELPDRDDPGPHPAPARARTSAPEPRPGGRPEQAPSPPATAEPSPTASPGEPTGSPSPSADDGGGGGDGEEEDDDCIIVVGDCD